jgi:prepilin-type N-terminal cleavage/methylation domain-containing protein
MRNLKKNQGFSLVELVIAVGLTGLVASAVVYYIQISMGQSKVLRTETELATTAELIRSQLHCDNTFKGGLEFPKVACAGGKYIALKNQLDKDIIPSGGITLGEWSFLARCVSEGFELRASMIKSAAIAPWDYAADDVNFSQHAITKKPLNWNWDPTNTHKHIIIDLNERCTDNFRKSGPPPDASGCNSQYVGSCINTPKLKVATADFVVQVPSGSGWCWTNEGISGDFLTGRAVGATVTCPVGWRVAGVGAKCDWTSGTEYGGSTIYNGLAAFPVGKQGGGIYLLSELTDGGQSVYQQCCTFFRGSMIPSFNNTTPSEAQGAAWATCVPAE